MTSKTTACSMLWTFPVNSETVQARSCTSRQVGDITTCITSDLFFATQSYRHFLQLQTDGFFLSDFDQILDCQNADENLGNDVD